METKPAIVGSQKTFVEMLQRLKPALGQLKPDEQSVERFLQLCRRLVQKNPDLTQCTVASLENAIKDSAALGLDPTGLQGRGYVLPFRNKRGDMEAVFIAGYLGLLDLAYRSGRVAGVQVKLVHKDDEWEYKEGLNPVLSHTPRFTGVFTYEDREDCVAGYCIWSDVLGGQAVAKRHQWLWLEEIERVRKLSKQTGRDGVSKFGPWVEHWQAMALKTVVRAAVKLMPMTPETSSAVEQVLSQEDSKLGMIDEFIDIPVDEPQTPEEGRRKIGAPVEEPPLDSDTP